MQGGEAENQDIVSCKDVVNEEHRDFLLLLKKQDAFKESYWK